MEHRGNDRAPCRKGGPLLLAWLFLPLAVPAGVTLPKLFTDNMVLQCDRPVPVWGTAAPQEKVTVSFAGQTRETQAGRDGAWRVDLAPLKTTREPSELTVTAGTVSRLQNVVVGEVWLCGGQSNMSMPIMATENAEAVADAADHPLLRLYYIHHASDLKAHGWVTKPSPEDVASHKWSAWKICTPQTLREDGERHGGWKTWYGFSATAYFFGRTLQAERGVPVGLIQAAIGGSAIQGWVEPGKNPMLKTVIPFAFRGVIWYQGESNHNDGLAYLGKFSLLAANWRAAWNHPSMPFYFAQIAPNAGYGGAQRPFALPEFWEAQRAITKAVPHTALIGTTDIGDLKDMHPKRKEPVGVRLAWQALDKTYGRKDRVADMPVFKSFTVEGKTARIAFDHVPTGLTTRDGKVPDWFEWLDEAGGGFVAAQARIDGKTVVLSAPQGSRPLAVRFGWSKCAEPNLMSREGLPVYPFRAGEEKAFRLFRALNGEYPHPLD